MSTDAFACRRPSRSLLFAGLLLPAAIGAQTLGTAFTYQGQLTESGQAANGLYDLQTCLFDSLTTPIAIGCAADANDVPVQAGVFTIALDFGAAPFAGQQRFLELRVRPGASSGSYTVLSPRQRLRPAPEALRANAASAAPWSGLTGVPAGFADGVDNVGVTSITAGTGLNGGIITGSGTISIANGGVGAAQIALGAIGATQLANNAVGFAQIDTTQVQARIAGTCAIGEYFRGVNIDGSLACEPVPGIPRISTLDDPANEVGDDLSIAIGADGLPVISYQDVTAGALKVARCANAACTGAASIAVVDDPANNVGGQTSIAIGADGLPVISYRDATANALKVAKCNNISCSSGATITTVDDPTNFVGFFTTIAIGNDGLPVISYRDFTAQSIKVAKCANAACSGAATITTVDDPATSVGISASMALGVDGAPVISYRDDAAQALRVAKCANAACTGAAIITIVDDPANNVGSATSIAIGADGLPVISYRDTTAGAFRVAKCSDAACALPATITTLDNTASDNGFYTSLAIAPDGLPVIAYSDATADALKVAKCANAACTGTPIITTVDDPANFVGRIPDIAIGADGLPVIAYLDFTAEALKVIKCGTRSCQ